MNNVSILPDKLATFEYYENKLPMWLKSSKTFKEHFRIWFDFLVTSTNALLCSESTICSESTFVKGLQYTGVIHTLDRILALINIFDDNYFSSSSSKTSKQDDWLDKIGKLFGVKRTLSVTYKENGQTMTYDLVLNNFELLKLIQCQIINNYYDGSYSQVKAYYEKTGLKVLYTTATQAATCDVYLLETEDAYSDNMKKLFLSGLLLIKSAGIVYTTSQLNLKSLLIWDKQVSGEYTGWDYGEWIA